MASLQQITGQITEAAVTRLSNPPFTTMVVEELTTDSWGSLRLDVVGVIPNREWVVGIEVKASKNDFNRGFDKFEKYMRYCNQFYVAAPRGMVDPKELPEGVGLLECGDTGKLRLKKRAAKRDMEPSRYAKILGRVVQKLVVEGTRQNQEAMWREQNKVYAFRFWLREHERPRQDVTFRS